MESEIFENTHEGNRRIIAVEEADKRLKMFVKQLESRGVVSGQKLKLKQSRRALQIFLGLNIYILDVKKVEFHQTTRLCSRWTALVSVCELWSHSEDSRDGA